jgi:phospholipid N-methyltransferase
MTPHPDRSYRDGANLDISTRPEWWLMLTKFLARGRTIASFAPSSRWMAGAMVKDIDFDAARCIVELGGGTGPITAELLRRLNKRCRSIILEIDPDLCRHLQRRFPEAEILEADAADLDRVLDERGIDKVDHVLSGLPLPSIPEPIRDRIIEASASRLAPEGTFRQLTIMPWVYYGLYRRYFQDVRFRFVFRNVPPGGVYICRGWQPQKT